MEAQERQATPKQVALIEKLRSEGRAEVLEPMESLSFAQASELISRSLDRAVPDGSDGKGRSFPGVSRRNDFGNGARWVWLSNVSTGIG